MSCPPEGYLPFLNLIRRVLPSPLSSEWFNDLMIFPDSEPPLSPKRTGSLSFRARLCSPGLRFGTLSSCPTVDIYYLSLVMTPYRDHLYPHRQTYLQDLRSLLHSLDNPSPSLFPGSRCNWSIFGSSFCPLRLAALGYQSILFFS